MNKYEEVANEIADLLGTGRFDPELGAMAGITTDPVALLLRKAFPEPRQCFICGTGLSPFCPEHQPYPAALPERGNPTSYARVFDGVCGVGYADCSLVEFARGLKYFIEAESSKANCDTHLIAVLQRAACIGWELARAVKDPISPVDVLRLQLFAANQAMEMSEARIKELEAAITYVVTQQGDDLCWMDPFTKLAALVGLDFDPKMLTREHMLANCARFVDSLLEGGAYVPSDPRAEATLLENILREMAGGMYGQPNEEWWKAAQHAAWRYANEFEPRFRSQMTVEERTETDHA